MAGNVFMSIENGAGNMTKYYFPRNLEICFQIYVSH